jgi:uncharacterized protein YciI
MRFVYCYQMKEDRGGVQDVAPKHAAYWHQLGLPGYVGGPFEDRSGGLILFEAPTEKRASELTSDDPFRRAGLVTDWWLKVWILE